MISEINDSQYEHSDNDDEYKPETTKIDSKRSTTLNEARKSISVVKPSYKMSSFPINLIVSKNIFKCILLKRN